MDVTVEELGKLKRKLTVEVPLSDVSAAYEDVYKRIRSNVRIDGFRPGKFPRSLAEKRFKELMGQEALQHLVPKYLEQVLQEKKLQPATQPQFQNLDIDKQRPFKFDVEFEIVPEFELVEAKQFKLDEKKVELESGAVDKRIEELRAARATAEEKSSAAVAGDIVTFDFEGTRDGQPFQGGSAKNQKADLGSGRYLEEFEKQLMGMSAGQEKSFTLTFPADYAQAYLAGQTAEFKVSVSKVEAKKPPGLDEEFFKQSGVADLDALRKQVEERLRGEREQEIEREYHARIAEQLRERYLFDVPQALIDNALADFERRQLQEHPELKDDPAKIEAGKAEEARRQTGDLRVSYALQRYAREYDIRVNPEDVRTRFMLQAYMLRQNPEELMRSQYGDMLLHQIQDQLLTNTTLSRIADIILGREIKPVPQAAEPGSGGAPDSGEHAHHDHEHHDHAHGEHDHRHD